MSLPPAQLPGGFHKAESLRNRTFIGLLVAQFLAAFNDQTIHASAMFFAISKKTLTEKSAISLMPILFFAPWAIFCTLAGYFADKYSKRFSLVFWKFAEIGITGLALVGFLLGSEMNMPNLGVWLVLATVFLMGTHSTFFVPAKYGAMPEILPDRLLSKGNGLLESLSFLATILGTVVGGLLSYYFHDDEYVIGLILVALACIGAAASLMIHRMPPANPNRSFPRYIYQPLWKNLKTLLKSHPLTFALVGIAFFTFMVAFMRAAVYMLGESHIPRWKEIETSGIVGMTALGIFLGSPLAGWLSGRKVELGLIPIGAVGMVVSICVAAAVLNSVMALVVCIILIGFFTGFYLVPMFTQLQHRAPKEMKGEVIATSNFVNVIGAIFASVLFYVLVWFAQTFGLAPPIDQTDIYVNSSLTALQEDRHHHPVFFQVQDAPGIGADIGRPPRPEGVPPIWDLDEDDVADPQVKVSQKALVAWNLGVERTPPGHDPPPIQVTVSKYVIRGATKEIPHYYIRLADERPEQLYDNRELPRYLFLGAAVMTLFVFLVLLRLLPDLPKRSLWLVRSLRKERLSVTGIPHLPGHGPVILVTNASTPEERGNVDSACDREVHFVSTGAVEEAVRFLGKGHVVGLPASGGEMATWEKAIDRFKSDVTVLPVYCGRAQVKIGPPLPTTATPEQVREAIRAAAEMPEH